NYGTDRGLPVSCITGDTWVNTFSGGKKAEDIQIGDLLLTHKGRFRKVTKVIPTKNRSDIWKLKVNSRMTNLYITGDHPVLTNLGWVPVSELDPARHMVAVNGSIDYPEKPHTLGMSNYCPYKFVVSEGLIRKSHEIRGRNRIEKSKNEDYVTYYKGIPEEVHVDSDLAWALGIWFAEGSLTTKEGKPTGIRIT